LHLTPQSGLHEAAGHTPLPRVALLQLDSPLALKRGNHKSLAETTVAPTEKGITNSQVVLLKDAVAGEPAEVAIERSEPIWHRIGRGAGSG
jgi:hypothetical protein